VSPDFSATAADGQPAIPADAHNRLASPEHNGGIRILRRGYSFTDGIDPQTGTLLGSLFFIAFMKDPAQFIRLQRSLAADALGEYIYHTVSSPARLGCAPASTGVTRCSRERGRRRGGQRRNTGARPAADSLRCSLRLHDD
jgi:hypothetical protein